MSKERQQIVCSAIAILFVIGVYIIGAFIANSMKPEMWMTEGRIAASIVSFFGFMFINFLPAIKNMNK